MKKTVIPFRNRYVYDADGTPAHRRLYEESFGLIPDGWHVHHVDAIKDNNDPANLLALPKSFHYWLHKDQKQYVSLVRAKLLSKEVLTALFKEYEEKEFNLRKSFLNTLLDRGFLRLGEKDAG